jgi:hypothetical protein
MVLRTVFVVVVVVVIACLTGPFSFLFSFGQHSG